MHFAVNAEQRAVGVDDDGRIVVDARRAPLKQRSDDDYPQLGGQPAKRCGGWTGDGFGQIEERGIFLAAEILRAEQLLEADNLRPAASGLADAPFGFGQVLVGVDGAGHLDEADAEFGGVHLLIFAEWTDG